MSETLECAKRAKPVPAVESTLAAWPAPVETEASVRSMPLVPTELYNELNDFLRECERDPAMSMPAAIAPHQNNHYQILNSVHQQPRGLGAPFVGPGCTVTFTNCHFSWTSPFKQYCCLFFVNSFKYIDCVTVRIISYYFNHVRSVRLIGIKWREIPCVRDVRAPKYVKVAL